MKKIGLIFAVMCSTLTYAQEDLDDMFDDGDKTSKLHIGTNVATLLGGTINANLDFSPVDKITFNIGAGFMPFSTHRDLTFFNIRGDYDANDIIPTDTSLSGGNFFTVAAKLNANMITDVDFDFYYYLGYRRKNFKLMEDQIGVNQNKISFGGGYKFGLIGRFNLDLQIGILYAFDTTTQLSHDYTFTGINVRNVELFELGDFEKRRRGGFDLGITLNYAL